MSNLLLPVVMIKNEERFIERVLTPLTNAFPVVVVGDTGSTDSTLEIVAKLPRVHLVHYPCTTGEELGLVRQHLQDVAAGLGATFALHVDGDEIYPTKYAQWVSEYPWPDTLTAGFTTGQDVAELTNGEWWFYNDARFNKVSVIPCATRWHGSYPFERIDTLLEEKPDLVCYPKAYTKPNQFYHVHTMRRSSKDADAYARVQKQYQFCMADRPDLKPTTYWLKNESEYMDGV